MVKASLALLALFAAWPAGAEGPTPVTFPLEGEMDAILSLAPRLNHNVLTYTKIDPEGRFQQVTTLVRVAAPREQVWRVLNDFENYRNLSPSIVSTRAREVSPNVYDVEVEVEVPLRNHVFKSRHRLTPMDRVTVTPLEGDETGSVAEWRLFPIEEGRATLLAHTMRADMRRANWFLRKIIRVMPEVQHSTNYLSSFVQVQGIRDMVEKGPLSARKKRTAEQ